MSCLKVNYFLSLLRGERTDAIHYCNILNMNKLKKINRRFPGEGGRAIGGGVFAAQSPRPAVCPFASFAAHVILSFFFSQEDFSLNQGFVFHEIIPKSLCSNKT